MHMIQAANPEKHCQASHAGGCGSRLQQGLFVAAVALLPFDVLPTAHYITSKASIFPATLGGGLWLLGGGWRGPSPAERRLWIMAAAFTLWVCLSTLVNGLEHLSLEPALTATFKAAVPLAVFLGAAAWTAGIFRNQPQQAFEMLHRGGLIAFGLCGAYGLAEIGYLLGSRYCRMFLEFTGPWFRAVGSSHGWWPPLVWEGRLRALTAEPSHFGFLLALLLPLLAYGVARRQEDPPAANAGRLLVLGYGLFLLALTMSKTAYLLAVAQIALGMGLWAAGKISRVSPRTIGCVFLGAALALLLAAETPGSASSSPNSGTASAASSDARQDSMTGMQHGSNMARLSMAQAEMRMVLDHPVLGFGYHQTHPHYFDYLPAKAWDVPEVWQWLDAYWQNPETALLPSINAYTRIAAEAGLPGLAAFTAIFIAPMAAACRGLRVRPSLETFTAIIAMAGLLLGWLATDRFISAAPYLLLGVMVPMAEACPWPTRPCPTRPCPDGNPPPRDEAAAGEAQ